VAVATVSVQLPEPLYRKLEGAAAITHRTVDEVLAATLAVALPPAPDLPPGLADELAEMIWLSDEALYAATLATFTHKQQARLAELNAIEDNRSLTELEQTEQVQLLAAYERSILRRAQAFAVLARRNHPVPQYSDLTLPT